MKLKVMTFNVQHCENFLTGEIDYDAVADVIRNAGADIVGLNEMRGNGTASDYNAETEELAVRLGMNGFFACAVCFDGVNPYGNALLSRYPIRSVKVVKIPDPVEKRNPDGFYETRCMYKAVIDVPGKRGGLCVVGTHFGLNSDEHENAVAVFEKTVNSRKCLFMGDLNVTPEDPVLAPVRARMKDTADLFGEEKLSFPSDKPERKIDYIFHTPDLRAVEADIPAIVVSDHRPHTAVFEV